MKLKLSALLKSMRSLANYTIWDFPHGKVSMFLLVDIPQEQLKGLKKQVSGCSHCEISQMQIWHTQSQEHFNLPSIYFYKSCKWRSLTKSPLLIQVKH